ncbi:VapE domain-containing protein [Alistipes shahii]|uniref:VapE domain-containing protein n=1 Tax=Alistipes shahii TaxID=328814 RepID=UPI00242E6599|nr:VapE domain-containing protein [Alistipes shahii]MCI7592519.1 virulence-associated E family protein [Alistipes shahii]
MYDPNQSQSLSTAPHGGITPDDSPAMDEMLQGVTSLTEVAPQPQGLQLKTTGGDTLIEQIELFLRARWIFRYNVVSNKAEFKLVKDPDAPFVEMRDFDYNSILRDLKYADLQCSMSTLRMILASKFMVEYDPYIEYTVNLPEYDGQTDYIEQLADTVATGNQVFWRRAFKKWFVAMAASWMQPEVVNHTALIMSGEQGIGKTTWLGNLIPTPLRKYVYAGMVNVRDKDSQVKLSECCIIIMDELENMSRNLDALKELITKRDIHIRRAYAFTHEHYTRRASFAGSINNKDFLHDITGNRRFLCFEAKQIDYRLFANLDKAYAQAVYLAQNGFQYWFSQDELTELEQNNEEFRAVIPEEEQLMAFYEPCTEDDADAVFMLNTEILKNLLRLSGLRTLSDQKLGRVLKARKFIRIKRQGRYGYLIKTKTQEVPTP